MEIDAFTALRRDEWNRMVELTRSGSLSGAQIDELIERYQAAASDLSALRTATGDTAQSVWLSVQIAKARRRLTRARRNPLLIVREFVVEQLPAALYSVRWWSFAAAAFAVLVSVLTFGLHQQHPELLSFYGSEAQLETYAEEDFINYYSEYSESAFAAKVFTNNALIAAQAIVLGITGIFPVVALVQNAVALGTSAAVLGHVGHLDAFFLWIAPHGLLELTMVFVAAGTGLSLFWAMIVPGQQPRMDAVGRAGRRLVIVAIGTTAFLFLSGLIEGFVTRQDWPWVIKIGIGALALGAYLAYALILGRRAHIAGHDGDLEESEAGYRSVYAG